MNSSDANSSAIASSASFARATRTRSFYNIMCILAAFGYIIYDLRPSGEYIPAWCSNSSHIYIHQSYRSHSRKKKMRMNSFRRVRDELVSDVMRGMSPERETVHA